MLWIGPKYRGNRLQDWEIRNGKAVCVVNVISPSGNPENKVYQDAAVIRSYLTKGKHLGKKEQNDLNSLFRETVPRTFIRFHTIMPDDRHE